MSTVCYDGPSNFIDIVEKDGYFLIKNFFKREAVEKARAELKIILDKDESRRKKMGGPAVDASVEFRSIYTKLMHTIWFPSLQSPSYLELTNDMFSSQYLKDFIRGLNMTRKHHLGNRDLLTLPPEYAAEAKLNQRFLPK